MTDQKDTTIVSSIHSDYLLEQLSDHYYDVGPGERGGEGVYTSVIFNGSQINAFVHESTITPVPQSIMDDLSPYTKLFHDTNDEYLTFYHVRCIGGRDAMETFLRKCTVEMCQRIKDGVLNCEDDHCDFFHSTLEVLVQIALEWHLTHTLIPLQQCIEVNHVPHCIIDGPEDCTLPDVMKEYIVTS